MIKEKNNSTTGKIVPSVPDSHYKSETNRYYTLGYFVLIFKDGVTQGSLTLLWVHSVLPFLVYTLSESPYLVSLAPVVLILASIMSGFFTFSESPIPKSRITFLALCVLLYLLTGSILYWFPTVNRAMMILLVLLSPFLLAFYGILPPWIKISLSSRLFLEQQQIRGMAMNALMVAGMGIFSGSIIHLVLRHFPGMKGYGILHLLVGAGLLLSYPLVMRMNKSPKKPGNFVSIQSFKERIKLIPKIFYRQDKFHNFFLMLLFSTGFYIILPFLGIYALTVIGKSECFLGYFVLSQMLGGLLAVIIIYSINWARAVKIPLFLGQSILLIISIQILFTQGEWGFLGLFFIFGFAFYFYTLGLEILINELFSSDQFHSYQYLTQIITLSGLGAVILLNSLIHLFSGHIFWASLFSAIFTGISLFFLLRIKN